MVDNFDVVETAHPELVAINKSGNMTGNIVDFCKFHVAASRNR